MIDTLFWASLKFFMSGILLLLAEGCVIAAVAIVVVIVDVIKEMRDN